VSAALAALWNGEIAGTLQLDGQGEMQFTCLVDWLEDDAKQALSVSVPKRPEPFARRECQPFLKACCPKNCSELRSPRLLAYRSATPFVCSNTSAVKSPVLSLLLKSAVPEPLDEGRPDS